MEYTQRGPVQGEKRFADDAFDSLTGVWNEPSVKRQIQGVMHGGGALFLCDIDCLKRINAQFGHLAGDDCLKQAAQILNYMIRKEDILGRTGGDEFVIFAPGCRDIETAGELGRRMEARFTSNRKKGSKEADFTMRIACTLRRKGDTYQSMLERVQEELRNKKYNISDWGGYYGDTDNYRKDVKQIREDLAEQIRKPGAYCRDYETFKSIYRFLERGIVRSGQKACAILITVVNEEGRSLIPYEKDVLMRRLGEDIRSELRIGDVYTRYSSSQYLVLVIDTTEHMAEMIARRIQNRFSENVEKKSILIHYCYALQPAKFFEEQEGELL